MSGNRKTHHPIFCSASLGGKRKRESTTLPRPSGKAKSLVAFVVGGGGSGKKSFVSALADACLQ